MIGHVKDTLKVFKEEKAKKEREELARKNEVLSSHIILYELRMGVFQIEMEKQRKEERRKRILDEKRKQALEDFEQRAKQKEKERLERELKKQKVLILFMEMD